MPQPLDLVPERFPTPDPSALRTLGESPILAAIDIGTNSIHMAVVRIDPTLPSFTIMAREKATVRLGDRDPDTGDLTPAAIDRALRALKRCRSLADSLQAGEIIAVATSAVREAPNGRDFLIQVKREVGIDVNLISGPEEARRIYLGVLSCMAFEGKPHAIIDIGGGSTELILGDGQAARYLSSTKIGAVRLTAEFVHSDPIAPEELAALRAYARGSIERAVEELHGQLAPHESPESLPLVGTSGTIECLVTIHAREALGVVPNRLQGYGLSYGALGELLDRLAQMPLAERMELPGMNDRRAEIVVAGAAILYETMGLLGISEVVACDRALREGVVVDWMLARGLIEDRLRYQQSIRDRSVFALARKYQVPLAAARHVATLALTFFDQTQGLLHGWGTVERELLWAAAILHHCGHHLNQSAHHKHAYYLIRHGELLGYTETEIEAIANLARYHRKSSPKKRHESYQALAGKRYRQMVEELSPFLRLAAVLERRQAQAIRRIQCQYRREEGHFKLLLEPANGADDCELELWNLDCERPVFEEQFGVTLTVELCPGGQGF